MTEMTTFKNAFQILKPTISTEAFEWMAGKTELEVEFTIYAELQDIRVLQQAVTKEVQQQVNISMDTDTDIRQRIRSINGKRWILTTKEPPERGFGNLETECDISKDMFGTLMRATKEKLVVKTRYFFPIPGTNLQWEVDVFNTKSGSEHPWVKIDLEVPNLEMEIPPLPFQVNSIIYADSDDLTIAEKRKIDTLWDEEWVTYDVK
jgi:hypothetical protein